MGVKQPFMLNNISKFTNKLKKVPVVGGFVDHVVKRLTGAGLPKGGEGTDILRATASWSTRDQKTDFRVKLTLPPTSDLYKVYFGYDKSTSGGLTSNPDFTINNLMLPLAPAGGVVFPLTPSIIINHSASYNPMIMPHSNYPHYAYQNSEIPSFTIVAEFPVQNQSDAKYWVAMLHFFRSVTKMFFGKDAAFKGNPPPILQMNGYGDHVFSNVPCVVTNFTCDLRQDVDYICTEQQESASDSIDELTVVNPDRNKSWAPTLSQVTVQVQPMYSRDSVKNFSMQKFIRGELTGRDNTVGYI